MPVTGVIDKKSFGFAELVIKEVSEERRIIRGIATSPEADRVGDIVEPLGCQFQNPIPFLWMHRHDMPIGTVKLGKPTKEGIPFEAELPIIKEPSQLAARIEEAWASIKNGLVRFVSIGFRPLEYAVIEETGGYRFTKSEIYELSAVVIPAQPNATINQIKAFDSDLRAASGKKDEEKQAPTPASVMAKHKTVKLNNQKEKTMPLSEKMQGFRDELASKRAKMLEMAEKSVTSSETFTKEESEEYDTLAGEVKTLEGHIERLELAMKASLATAKPVDAVAVQKTQAASDARGSQPSFIQVKAPQQLDKGIAFARLARCKALAKMHGAPAYEIAKESYGEDSPIYGILKAAVAAGTTSHATWAGPLVGEEGKVFADFVEYLRPMTILGRFGTNGVPSLRSVPFRTRLISQTSGGAAKWVGEAKAKPLTKFDFAGTSLEPLKVANIAVVTMELIRDSSPSAEAIVRDALAAAIAERLDIDFVDPDKAVDAGVSPASITNGVTPIVSSGTDADAVRCDIVALLQSYAAANNPPTSGVIIMSAGLAITLMGMRNALGSREFPDITMNGGVLEGFPVITSQYLSTFDDSAGGFVFMVNASDIWVGDEGGINVDMSDQASLQMDDAPTQHGDGTPTATSVVSLWQNNLVGFRAERTINWAKRRATAVAVLSGVLWSACDNS